MFKEKWSLMKKDVLSKALLLYQFVLDNDIVIFKESDGRAAKLLIIIDASKKNSIIFSRL